MPGVPDSPSRKNPTDRCGTSACIGAFQFIEFPRGPVSHIRLIRLWRHVGATLISGESHFATAIARYSVTKIETSSRRLTPPTSQTTVDGGEADRRTVSALVIALVRKVGWRSRCSIEARADGPLSLMTGSARAEARSFAPIRHQALAGGQEGSFVAVLYLFIAGTDQSKDCCGPRAI